MEHTPYVFLSPMDAVPPELAHIICEWTDALTLPVVRCTSARWCAIVDGFYVRVRATPEIERKRSYRHRDFPRYRLQAACVSYAGIMIGARRWPLFELVMACTGALDGYAILGERACNAVAADGDLDRLMGFIDKGFTHDREQMAMESIKGAHLHVLRWLEERGYRPRDTYLCALAASRGTICVLEWLTRRGCPWDSCTSSFAAEYGHLATLKWARRRGCPWDKGTCTRAARNGHLDIVKWARKHGCPWDARTCSHAAAGGHMDVLQWARKEECLWDADTCTFAARGGHLGVLRWAHAQGCPLTYQAYVGAVECGHLHVMEWLESVGHVWSSNLTMAAVLHGHLCILEWAFDRKHPLDEKAFAYAAKCGRLDILGWARINNLLRLKGH